MIRTLSVLGTLLVLTACGGGARFDATTTRVAVVPYATGPIQSACMTGGRKAASSARCGCIQAVANRSLSSGHQRRGAGYFNEPARLQEVRQSDRSSDERFWLAWKAFGQDARICEAV